MTGVLGRWRGARLLVILVAWIALSGQAAPREDPVEPRASDAGPPPDGEHPSTDPEVDPGARTPTEARIVRVTLWDEDAEAAKLESLIRELLAPLPVRVDLAPPREVRLQDVATPPPSSVPALARVFVAAHPRRFDLFVVDEPWDRVLRRSIETPTGEADRVVREQIAQIVLATVESLLAGRRIGRARAELLADLQAAPSTAPEPQAPIASDEPETPAPKTEGGDGGAWGSALGLSYVLRLQRGGFHPRHEIGLGAQLIRSGSAAVRFSAGLDVVALVPESVTSPGLRLDMTGMRAGVGVGLVAVLMPALRLRGSIGGAAELIRVDPDSDDSNALLRVRDPALFIRPSIFGRLGFEVVLADRWTLACGADVLIGFEPLRYVVVEDGTHRAVVSLWPVRPGAWAAVGVLF